MIRIERLKELYTKGKEVMKTEDGGSEFFPSTVDEGQFYGWKTQVINYLKNEIGEVHHYVTAFDSLVNDFYPSTVETGLNIINSIIEDVDRGDIVSLKEGETPKENSIQIIEKICDRFHRCARKLRRRHENRETIDIKDEYDVQDFLNVLLEVHFDDIRPEEYTPSYAGSSSRMDFLLKREQIVIEVKMTRSTLKDKEIGKQLIEDIARYQSHPDCDKLVCFVYDPDGYISNPRGLENDLNQLNDKVKLLIRPE